MQTATHWLPLPRRRSRERVGVKPVSNRAPALPGPAGTSPAHYRSLQVTLGPRASDLTNPFPIPSPSAGRIVKQASPEEG
jgi:hypothetical protein